MINVDSLCNRNFSNWNFSSNSALHFSALPLPSHSLTALLTTTCSGFFKLMSSAWGHGHVRVRTEIFSYNCKRAMYLCMPIYSYQNWSHREGCDGKEYYNRINRWRLARLVDSRISSLFGQTIRALPHTVTAFSFFTRKTDYASLECCKNFLIQQSRKITQVDIYAL